jgi:hypothetical protein
MTPADVLSRIRLPYDDHIVTGGLMTEVKLTVRPHRRLIVASLRNGGLSQPA